MGHGNHPVVVVSHPTRAGRKDLVEVLDCSSQRANRAPFENEVILDKSDGMDWQTCCKCDLIYLVARDDLKKHRGSVAPERRRQIVRAIILTHGWNAL